MMTVSLLYKYFIQSLFYVLVTGLLPLAMTFVSCVMYHTYFVLTISLASLCKHDKKLCYRKGTARCACQYRKKLAIDE